MASSQPSLGSSVFSWTTFNPQYPAAFCPFTLPRSLKTRHSKTILHSSLLFCTISNSCAFRAFAGSETNLSWLSRYNIYDNKLLPPITDGHAFLLRGTVFAENTKQPPTAIPLIRQSHQEIESAHESAQHGGCQHRTLKTNVLQPKWMSKNRNAPQIDVARSSEIPSQHLRRLDPHVFVL